eukprot:3246694-Rhodomonas_salina.3
MRMVRSMAVGAWGTPQHAPARSAAGEQRLRHGDRDTEAETRRQRHGDRDTETETRRQRHGDRVHDRERRQTLATALGVKTRLRAPWSHAARLGEQTAETDPRAPLPALSCAFRRVVLAGGTGPRGGWEKARVGVAVRYDRGHPHSVWSCAHAPSAVASRFVGLWVCGFVGLVGRWGGSDRGVNKEGDALLEVVDGAVKALPHSDSHAHTPRAQHMPAKQRTPSRRGVAHQAGQRVGGA